MGGGRLRREFVGVFRQSFGSSLLVLNLPNALSGFRKVDQSFRSIKFRPVERGFELEKGNVSS